MMFSGGEGWNKSSNESAEESSRKSFILHGICGAVKLSFGASPSMKTRFPMAFAFSVWMFILGFSTSGAWGKTDEYFTFQPAKDDFQPNILDVSRWVEAPTGKHGFLGRRGDQFVFEDGTPARFWGAQMNPLEKEQADYTVRRMRRQGINITRMHGLEFLNTRDGKTSFDYNREAWDRFDYMIAKL